MRALFANCNDHAGIFEMPCRVPFFLEINVSSSSRDPDRKKWCSTRSVIGFKCTPRGAVMSMSCPGNPNGHATARNRIDRLLCVATKSSPAKYKWLGESTVMHRTGRDFTRSTPMMYRESTASTGRASSARSMNGFSPPDGDQLNVPSAGLSANFTPSDRNRARSPGDALTRTRRPRASDSPCLSMCRCNTSTRCHQQNPRARAGVADRTSAASASRP